MNWSLVIQLLIILSIKLIGTTLFLQYSSEILYTSPSQDVPDSNQDGAKVCPISWVPFEGKCYYFSTHYKTWNNSESNCVQSNAHLVVVNCNAKLMFLKNLTKDKDYFVGLTKRGIGGKWKWIDNTDLDQSIFSINIPHNDQDCAIVGFSKTGTVSCSVPNRWICEMNA